MTIVRDAPSSCRRCALISISIASVVEVLLYVHRFIRDGSPGRPPRLSHSSRSLYCVSVMSAVSLFSRGLGLAGKCKTLFLGILARGLSSGDV